jgi:hypothetical protein
MPPIRSHLQANAPLNRQPEETKLAPSNPELFLKKIHFQPLITLKYTKCKRSMFQTQPSIGAGARTESLGKLEEEQP